MPVRPPIHQTYKPAPVKRKSAWERGYDGVWNKGARRAALNRDKWRCVMCGQKLFLKKQMAHVDHIIDKVDGGTDDLSNLRSLCHSCHSKRTVKESGGFGNPKHRPAGIGGGAIRKPTPPPTDDFYVA